jgi:glycosyltransferase involved in cell wall biosynthesis
MAAKSLYRVDPPTQASVATKPVMLMAIYAHADQYPPTINAARILSDDFRVRVVCRNTDAPAVEWHREVQVERVGPLRTQSAQKEAGGASKLLEFSRFVRSLRITISRSGAKIIYAYDPIAFAAAMLARPGGVPVVFHCHDTPDFENLSNRSLQTWLFRYALKRTRDAEFVVFPEAARAAFWMKAAGDDRAPLIAWNGAARNFFPAPNWEALSDRRFNDRLALYMGWIGPEHGELNAIRAIGMTEGAKLALIGSPHADFVATIVQTVSESHAAERVELHSWSTNEKKHLLERAALGLIVYRPLSMNLNFVASAVIKLFEYGAAGLPLVVPEAGNYREFLRDEKWVAFADVEDPRSIARAIEYILADRDRYLAMSRAAREAHEKRLNYELLFAPVVERLRAMVAAQCLSSAN